MFVVLIKGLYLSSIQLINCYCAEEHDPPVGSKDGAGGEGSAEEEAKK